MIESYGCERWIIMENKENKMGSTPLLPLIFSMSIPAMFSMLIQALYNVVDSVFVAQVAENALTAVSIAFPIQTLMIALGVGTGVGINSLVARRLGEKKKDDASKAVSHGFFLGVCSWIVFALFGIFGTRFFVGLYSNDAEIVAMATSYISIVTIFSFGSFIQINNEKSLQATGNMFYPMLFQLVGAITNIILDPILIFGLFGLPKMGVAGAAYATVIGQIIAMLFSMYIMLTKSHEVHVKLKGFRPDFKIIKEIYEVGIPSIIMQAIGSVLVMGLNGILSRFSDTAVAVLGVYYKLQSFVFMPVFGLNQGIMPIMGYNFGARNKERIFGALKIGISVALVIMCVGMFAFNLIPDLLLSIFKPSPELLAIGVPALKTISLCFPLAAISIIISTVFQAIGKGKNSLYISLFRQLIFLLPSAYVLANFGLDYVWYSFVIAEGAAFVVSIIMYRSVKVNVLNNLVSNSIK